MQDKTLLTISVVTDDDSGIYRISELDFGKSGHCEEFLKKPNNRKRFAGWLRWLANAAECGTAPFFRHDRSPEPADKFVEAMRQ